jgi:hypothetical protein
MLLIDLSSASSQFGGAILIGMALAARNGRSKASPHQFGHS